MTPIINKYDPRLKQACEPYDFSIGVPWGETYIGAQALFELLRDTMCSERGIGLAAPQLGIMARVFVIGNPDDPDSVIPVFNPTIVNFSGPEEEYEEGCLTFPGLYLAIKRPTIIRARYTNADGQTDTINFEGLTARVFQHEYDHLSGVLFTSKVHRHHLERAQKDMIKINRQRKRNENQQRRSSTDVQTGAIR